MRVHTHRSRAIRALAAAGVLAATMSIGITSSSAAPILATTTSVVTSANPALAGSPVTLTATVKILNTNLGPITPKGTVTFKLGNTVVGTSPLSSCVILLTPCTASTTVTAPAETSEGVVVTATYNGDALAKPSTGSLTQYSNDPIDCLAAEYCDGYVASADGTASLRVNTDGNGAADYLLEMSFQSKALSCTQAGTGATAVFNVTDNQVSKTVQYTSYGAAATTNNQNPDRACWGSDQPFTTASGAPATQISQEPPHYEGLLPLCGDGANPPPCVESSGYYVSEGGTPILYLYIEAPAGDPQVTR